MADGFEEIEAVATLDLLRRGGVAVESVAIGSSKSVRGSHGIAVEADRTLDEVLGGEAACLVFPGGMPGSRSLAACDRLMDWLAVHYARGGIVGAICAAPAWVLCRLPMPLAMTCYPGFEQLLPEAQLTAEGVVVDGRVVTARSGGYALDFGLKLVSILSSEERAAEVAADLLIK